jgi:TonB-dependent SusC/RagA subfamily outer membrane receptor
MKNILKTSLYCILLLYCSTAMYAQEEQNISAKERRQARKEARKLERAVIDSLKHARYSDEDINIGYGTVKRRNLTTSVSKVSVEDNLMGSYTNIADYLMGRVPGLSVTKQGGGYKYTIRGINSINLSTDPLFIVDGVETMSIDYLNPRDIQSVEVIKDGSASIYGSRGANGVILITTKR